MAWVVLALTFGGFSLGILALLWERYRVRLLKLGGLCLVLIGALTAVLAYRSPTGTPSEPGLVRHTPEGFPRYSPLNLIPEEDQVAVALGVGRWFGPHESLLRELPQWVLPAYDRVRNRPGYRDLGSFTPFAWSDLRTADRVAYLPPGEEHPPLIIFLHGSLGNFQTHVLLMQEFCQSQGYALVCPTYGLGFWERGPVEEAVDQALLFATEQLGADPKRVVLFGHSNGALGCLRALKDQPERYLGAVIVSGVLEGEVAAPVLVLHGGRDAVTSPAAARDWAERNQVDYVDYPEAGHALFYTHQRAILEIAGRWIAARMNAR